MGKVSYHSRSVILALLNVLNWACYLVLPQQRHFSVFSEISEADNTNFHKIRSGRQAVLLEILLRNCIVKEIQILILYHITKIFKGANPQL